MIRTLLIANRGEIACRIMRSARALGMTTVAVYSDADARALHVRTADHAIRIGEAAASLSYLNIGAIMTAARASGADALHPGYGFLSENAELAAACLASGVTFVGPSPEAISVMGSKRAAKQLVARAGIPVVPGYEGDDQSDERLVSEANRIGYPLLIKASAGGGGRGMRLVRSADEVRAALAGARREALAAFADDSVLLERYLTRPKHIEVQVLSDKRGHTLHLFERDCSVQRRHQKVIEEAPALGIDSALRRQLGEAAVAVAKAISYEGAGTVEFIVQDGAFHFLEMNTRLQVEHPVTEAITGFDLVAWQLRIASGLPLDIAQDDIQRDGHAVEARVYAENPLRGFLPSSGPVLHARFPTDIRTDIGIESGDEVSVHYDPMLAKIIAHGPDRSAAIAALDKALAETELLGIEHNVGFLRRVLATRAFSEGVYTTRLIEDAADTLYPQPDPMGAVIAAVALLVAAQGDGPWGVSDGFRVNQGTAIPFELICADHRVTLLLTESAQDRAQTIVIEGQSLPLVDLGSTRERVRILVGTARIEAAVRVEGRVVHVARDGSGERWQLPEMRHDLHDAAPGERVLAPMPGQVIEVSVGVGDWVEAGALLIVVEAMKMEHGLRAPRSGRVRAIACNVGDRVQEGVELVQLEDEAMAEADKTLE
ncbi:MAG: biotin carboxylase N-terminal domain-containing protein [Pseudomonadales bacterium]